MKRNVHNRDLKIRQFTSVDQLYKSITNEGSLGLLALGYKGLIMWRKKRAENEVSEKPDNEKK